MDLFERLIEKSCGTRSHIRMTDDGFAAFFVSLSSILHVLGTDTYRDINSDICRCDFFYDDWYLYRIGSVYSLLKLREQEHDAELGADGDSPGVTVCFIAFDEKRLEACLDCASEENVSALSLEINRVVSYRQQEHNDALKDYFSREEAKAPYVICDMYIEHLSQFAENGIIPLPDCYEERTAGEKRIPEFLEELNRSAGRTVCDGRFIYIGDKNSLTPEEKYALLAAHTGNVSYNSFAAEVCYHAKFLFSLAKMPIPFAGKSVYDSAIRADMSIDDAETQGPAPFYNEKSRLIAKQIKHHGKR